MQPYKVSGSPEDSCPRSKTVELVDRNINALAVDDLDEILAKEFAGVPRGNIKIWAIDHHRIVIKAQWIPR